jgi:hypothetical protein
MMSGREFDSVQYYRIRVKGLLGPEWSGWFDGMAVEPQSGEETLLTGPAADQAALHGLLNKVRDLGLPLLSVEIVDTPQD